jgi:hypothetical protein
MTPTPARWDIDTGTYWADVGDGLWSEDGQSWADKDNGPPRPEENTLLVLIGGPADGRQIRLYADAD